MLVRAFSLLLLLGFIWGSGYSIARYAITHSVTPLGYAMWQSLGPAIVLSLLTLKRWSGQLKQLFRFWPYYLVTGLFGIVIPNTNMYFIAPHLPAGVIAVIVNIVPLLVYPLSIVTKQESFNVWRMSGVMIGMLGILLFIIPEMSLGHGFIIYWALMTFISPLSFAICVIFIGAYRPQVDSLVLSAGMLFFATLLLVPVVYQSGQFYVVRLPINWIDSIIFLEIVLSSLGYVILFKLIKLAGAVYYSLVSGVVCLTGLFWGSILFGEKMSLLMGMAVILIVSAIALVSTHPEAYVAFPKIKSKEIDHWFNFISTKKSRS